MLFTSLITMLKSRSEEGYACLPLLRYLPPSQVLDMRIEPIEGYKPFPHIQNIADLENGQWPKATEEAFGFKLVVRLKETASLKRHVLPHSDVVFEFIDYPGEWVTDIPMLSKTYAIGQTLRGLSLAVGRSSILPTSGKRLLISLILSKSQPNSAFSCWLMPIAIIW